MQTLVTEDELTSHAVMLLMVKLLIYILNARGR